jgi:DNA-binding response OmpR family regulator
MSLRILIVEDEGITALDVEQYLTEEGYSVCTAANAREGAEKNHAFCPDLVVMDIDLKGPRDGIELAQQLQKTSNAGIVYLTGRGECDIRARAESTRPLGFILKPFEVSDLKLAIKIALCRREFRCRAKNQVSPFVVHVHSLEQQPLVRLQLRCPLEQECMKSPQAC